jgi:putative transposase
MYRRRRPPEPRDPKPRPKPSRALSSEEREEVLEVLHSDRFADSSPAAVWATLLDEGRYLASERTMYRILAEQDESRERRDQLVHPAYAKPELLATRPNELWSWDITKLLGPAKWTYFYLYVLLDIFSRYVVGWTIQHRESAEVAKAHRAEHRAAGGRARLAHGARRPRLRDDVQARGVPARRPRRHQDALPALHLDGQPLLGGPVQDIQVPAWLPRSLRLDPARTLLGRDFFPWYNHEHRHCGIGLMTPAMVHYGQAEEVKRQRARVLAAAYAANPERFVRGLPQPPKLPTAAWINPPNTQEAAH